jgi:hypothetical protein
MVDLLRDGPGRRVTFDDLLVDGIPLRSILLSSHQLPITIDDAPMEWQAPLTPLRHDKPGRAVETLLQWLGERRATFQGKRSLVLGETGDYYSHGVTCRVDIEDGHVRWHDFASEGFEWILSEGTPDHHEAERFSPPLTCTFEREPYEAELRAALAGFRLSAANRYGRFRLRAANRSERWYDGSTNHPQKWRP